MTAPDPGLTDLIAAHQERPHHDGWICSCGVEGPERIHAAHVALVVEQQTNGRLAELEAELAEAKDDKFYARVELNADAQWKARAEKAEATIARVRDALTIGPLHRLNFPKYKDPYAIDRHVIRAALEGEQQ
ncbi:hypothetical protein ACIQYZ_14690 [Rhodococcus erythropolis]